jgi:hypothetical protein
MNITNCNFWTKNYIHISKGRFRGTDFWVEVKKQPAYPYAVLLQEISKNGVL